MSVPCGLLSLSLSFSFFLLSSSEFLEGDFSVEHDTYLTSSNIKQAAARSLVQCSNACLKINTCQYAAFNKMKETCMVTYDSSYDAGTHELGWMFIKVSAPKTCTSCVRFYFSWYKFVDTLLQMSDAKANCMSLGGKLVEVETELENNYLKDKLKRFKTKNNFWMGAYSYTSDSSFNWFSKPNEPLKFKEFGQGEPNGPLNEFCLAFYQPYGYSWIDLECVGKLSHICELSV